MEKRSANGLVDYIALALTTVGVGYIPGAPGTYGSAVGVAIYLGVFAGIARLDEMFPVRATGFSQYMAMRWALIPVVLTAFCLIGIWASGRTAPIFGRKDPSQAVVDEVMGQLITYCFVPFGLTWPFIVLGFLLFRMFDIFKPFPVRTLEVLPGGLGICADDIVAGVYAGLCLAAVYTVYLFL
ncbi:MAG: phosphatidylglycerophosphatase A [Acidobacteria bacterium]|nr:phosphatidylglycerophosphatase A [Acidobacteriota bacterium]